MMSRKGREGGKGFLWTKFFDRSNVKFESYGNSNNQIRISR
jgi:hypothetical protein